MQNFLKEKYCATKLETTEAILDDLQNPGHHEKFQVNFARTSPYQNLAIPSIQRRLNQHFQ